MNRFEFDFSDLETVAEIPFTYKGEKYILKEANSKVGAIFNNEKVARITFKNGKPAGMRLMGDLAAILVHHCTVVAETGKNVHPSVIAQWPNKMVEDLYDKAKEISGLQDESDLGKNLRRALNRPDSPVSLQNVRDWCDTLPEEDFEDVIKLFELSEEEKAKNEQSSTTDISA